MDNKLLTDSEWAWSAAVANNAMNRERKATGVNSYEKDIKLNPNYTGQSVVDSVYALK